uniref:F-box associated beta-propeller type 1 domain-containing protein n=1 Tax=Salix viminalis TaxID=40686 RepID=A0A6N2K9T2_SALVM
MVQIKSRIFLTHVEERATDNNILEVEKTHFDIKVKFPGCNFDVVGSCNGLLCLEITKLTGFKSDPDYRSDPGYKSVCVCNPFLDEYVTIPIIPMEERDIMRLGFGNSALSKQYKVIQLFYYGESHKYLRAEIYTIGTGRWRSVGNAPGKVCCLDRYGGAFLHGSLHTVHYYSGPYGFICVFDFESEKFRQFSLPLQCANERFRGLISLGVVEGCLCMSISTHSNPKEFCIWVMKEYGVRDSWTKQFVIENVNVHPYFDYYMPLIFFSNGKILMNRKGIHVASYDTRLKRFQKSIVYNSGEMIWAIKFKPTFVSVQDIAPGEQRNSVRN